MLKQLKIVYLRAQFNPGFLGLFVNPFYFARKGLRENLEACAHHMKGRLLDVGCGTKPYRNLFSVEEYTGLEIDTPPNHERNLADFFYDGVTFPFQSESYNSVLTNQVLEHVFNPEIFLAEIYRVLKPGGNLLLTVPFVWDEHEQPWDYARYSSFGLIHLVEKMGFKVVESRKSMADFRLIFQLASAYLYKITDTHNPYINPVIHLVLMAPLNIVGSVFGYFLPRNSDLFLDNILVARKPE